MSHNLVNTLFIFGAKYPYLFIIGITSIYFARQPRTRQKDIIAFVVLTFPIMYIVLKLAVLLYFDPRPFVTGHFISLIPHAPDNGFPSDHTLLSAAIASVIFPYDKKVSALLWALTIMVAVSRVYVGLHHSVDVAASIVIAIVVCLLAYPVVPKVYRVLWENKYIKNRFVL